MKKLGEWVFYAAVMFFVVGVWLIQSWYIVVYDWDLVVGFFAIIGAIATVRFFVRQYKRTRRPR